MVVVRGAFGWGGGGGGGGEAMFSIFISITFLIVLWGGGGSGGGCGSLLPAARRKRHSSLSTPCFNRVFSRASEGSASLHNLEDTDRYATVLKPSDTFLMPSSEKQSKASMNSCSA